MHKNKDRPFSRRIQNGRLSMRLSRLQLFRSTVDALCSLDTPQSGPIFVGLLRRILLWSVFNRSLGKLLLE